VVVDRALPEVAELAVGAVDEGDGDAVSPPVRRGEGGHDVGPLRREVRPPAHAVLDEELLDAREVARLVHRQEAHGDALAGLVAAVADELWELDAAGPAPRRPHVEDDGVGVERADLLLEADGGEGDERRGLAGRGRGGGGLGAGGGLLGGAAAGGEEGEGEDGGEGTHTRSGSAAAGERGRGRNGARRLRGAGDGRGESGKGSPRGAPPRGAPPRPPRRRRSGARGA